MIKLLIYIAKKIPEKVNKRKIRQSCCFDDRKIK